MWMGVDGWALGMVVAGRGAVHFNPALSSECKIEHCEACFSHNFCTKCKESLYLHKGRCYPACPEGSAAANGTMECSSPGKAG